MAHAAEVELYAVLQKEGVAIVREFMPPDALQRLTVQMERVARSIPSLVSAGKVPPEHMMHDDVARHSTLKQIQQLSRVDPYFTGLVDQLTPLAACALGEDAVFQNMQYFDKPPTAAYDLGDCSRPTPPHQDGYYFMIEPPGQAVTMWLAVDAADEENGCLRYVRGSAARGLRPHDFSGVMGFSQRLVAYRDDDAAAEFAAVAAPGDLIIHTGGMIHRAGANTSRRRHRRAIGLIFYGASARVDVDRHAARQAEIHRRARLLTGQGATGQRKA